MPGRVEEKGKGTKFLEGIAEKAVRENGASKLQWWIMVSLWGIIVFAGGGWAAHITSKIDAVYANREQIGVMNARITALEGKEFPQLIWLKERIDRLEGKIDRIQGDIGRIQKKMSEG